MDEDGDGTLESAWLQPPKMFANGSESIGDCGCKTRFSNPEIPQDGYTDGIGGTWTNVTNLNQGPGDEVGLIPSWFTSCSKGLYVDALKRGTLFQPLPSDRIAKRSHSWGSWGSPHRGRPQKTRLRHHPQPGP